MRLVIGNKRYSSWSLRPWIGLTMAGIDFEEILIPLDTPTFKETALQYNPTGKVPCLIDGDAVVWESLAILEYAADRFPDRGMWPADPVARARGRSISCEMISGFTGIRSANPMNLRTVFAYRDWGEAARRDVKRITALWADTRAAFGAGGPFLFGKTFTIADAMFAPVTQRLTGYSWPMDVATAAYVEAVQSTHAFQSWKAAADREPWIVDADEIEPVTAPSA
jgi:glutathione S-transferase